LQAKAKSAFAVRCHRKYSSAIRAIESLASFSGGGEMGRIGVPSLFSFATVLPLGCPEIAAEA
jgi:nicotinate-nucleotide pyrophosphorylase